MRDYLHRAGFDVLEAADGPAALSLARTEKSDMIVLDLGLPGRDGLDVTRELRRDVVGADHHAHRPQRGDGPDRRA